MKRILLLATTTGYQTRAFGDAAQRLGVELVFATDRCNQLDDPWQDGAIPIRFYDEDASVAAIASAGAFDGVLAVGDRPTVIAARVAAVLGLPGHPPDAAAIARDKQRTRECFRDAGLPVPRFMPFSLTDAGTRGAGLSGPPYGCTYPCVVKPVSLSGSRGVMRADDDASFDAAVKRLRALMQSPDLRAERSDAHERALVEEFVPGREYAVEALLHQGALYLLAIFDKPDPLDGPFFEETIYLTPSAAPAGTQAAIVESVRRAARAIGLHHGPVHAECRVNDRGVVVLEVAARPIGGLCARTLRFVADRSRNLGYGQLSLEELLLRHALGESPEPWRTAPRASGVMMIPIPHAGILRGVEGLDEARRVPHITEIHITAKNDQRLVPLPEGASYLGFIFARAAHAAMVEHALRAAHRRLRFAIAPELPVRAAAQVEYNQRHG